MSPGREGGWCRGQDAALILGHEVLAVHRRHPGDALNLLVAESRRPQRLPHSILRDRLGPDTAAGGLADDRSDLEQREVFRAVDGLDLPTRPAPRQQPGGQRSRRYRAGPPTAARSPSASTPAAPRRASPSISPAPERISAPMLLRKTVRPTAFSVTARAALAPSMVYQATGSAPWSMPGGRGDDDPHAPCLPCRTTRQCQPVHFVHSGRMPAGHLRST